MQKEELRQLLNQPYQKENWKKVIDFVFPNVAYLPYPKDIPNTNKKVESFKQLGFVRLNDGKNLAMFEVHVAENVNIARNRVELRNLVADTIDQDTNHGVLVIYEQGKADYRFTFTAKASEIDMETGAFSTKETDSKRYTYVLGENESCKTAAQRFVSLAEKKEHSTIDDVQEAFSVEKVSKQFFKEYKTHYQNMVDYLLSVDSYKKTIFKGDDKAVRDFVKLLLGRLVFIQFVQKKRWMGVPATEKGWTNGDARFLYNSFRNFEFKNSFYSLFLEPLFYEAMNNGGRKDELFKPTGTKVPYLNGGLFEKGETDTSLINFPAAYFESLFEFFDQYNFTIDENDPEEHEVGIDPEMLGHVFENLLEDNKDKGAFYTPKEIVHYMCQESLKEYLKTSLEEKKLWPADEEQAKELEGNLQNFVQKKEASNIIDYDEVLAIALRDVKICDPAIGSGAFPMGLLNEIYQCINILYDASPDIVGDVWGMETWQPNVVKANIIQNSIYGVDIEKGAVDIARLRFWLSLIVDEPEPTALPNLDYKIAVGNSLLSKFEDEIIDIEWNAKGSVGKADEFIKKLKSSLISLSNKQKEFFDSNDKNHLKAEIRNLKLEILINQLSFNRQQFANRNEIKPDLGFGLRPNEIKKNLEITMKLAGIDQRLKKLQKLQTNPDQAFLFFDWKLNFPEIMNEQVAEKVGFDILIANPPYIEAKKLKHISQFLKGYRVYSGTADLSSYFFELAAYLSKTDGIITLINTNKFFNTGYGKPVRTLILQNEIKQLLNFEQVEVFEGILVSSVIVGFKKKLPNDNIFPFKKFFKMKNLEFKSRFVLDINNRDKYIQNNLTDAEWSFAKESNLLIKDKIELKATKLNELDGISIYRGVTTGYNPAFIINDEQKAELIKKDIKNGELIKSLLQGRNIRKWIYNESDENLIFTKQGIDIKKYPSIEEYLKELYDDLKPRNNGETRGRKPGNYKWFEIQDNTAYYSEFEKPEKIIWGLTADKWAYAYDDKRHFLPSNGYILTSDIIPIKYLLGLLNSNLLKYYFSFIGVMTAGGAFTLKHATIQQLPIRQAKNQALIIDKVNKVLAFKSEGKDSSYIENQIDNLIYKLYELTYDEVLVVEPEFAERMSREAYEKLKIE